MRAPILAEKPPRRRSRVGCAGWLAAVAILIAVAWGLDGLARYIDRQRFPWGYADSDTPPLVGTWVGRFTTRSGKPLAMQIDLAFVELGRGRRGTPIVRTRRHDWLEGRVRVCDGPGSIRRLNASGEPDDNAATRFHLSTSSADGTASPEGLAPSHIFARFNGDTVAGEASLYLRRGTSAITNTADPDIGLQKTAFTLKRGTGTTFESLCREL
jgi:hypothetical protein